MLRYQHDTERSVNLDKLENDRLESEGQARARANYINSTHAEMTYKSMGENL